MSPLNQLAHDVTLSPHFRWMAGMLATDGAIAWRIVHDGARLWAVPNLPDVDLGTSDPALPAQRVPERPTTWSLVLTDPATAGCLWVLHRARLDAARLAAFPDSRPLFNTPERIVDTAAEVCAILVAK